MFCYFIVILAHLVIKTILDNTKQFAKEVVREPLWAIDEIDNYFSAVFKTKFTHLSAVQSAKNTNNSKQ